MPAITMLNKWLTARLRYCRTEGFRFLEMAECKLLICYWWSGAYARVSELSRFKNAILMTRRTSLAIKDYVFFLVNHSQYSVNYILLIHMDSPFYKVLFFSSSLLFPHGHCNAMQTCDFAGAQEIGFIVL